VTGRRDRQLGGAEAILVRVSTTAALGSPGVELVTYR
jgi:hypothetical protein